MLATPLGTAAMCVRSV